MTSSLYTIRLPLLLFEMCIHYNSNYLEFVCNDVTNCDFFHKFTLFELTRVKSIQRWAYTPVTNGN